VLLPIVRSGTGAEHCRYFDQIHRSDTGDGFRRICGGIAMSADQAAHHPDCGLLYDDGPDECTCGVVHPLSQMLATAQLMAICAAMGMPFVQEEL